MTKVSESARIASASGVVGPLAPSTMARAWVRAALSALMTPSSAAGMRTSQGSSSSSAFEIGRPFGKPARLRCSV